MADAHPHSAGDAGAGRGTPPRRGRRTWPVVLAAAGLAVALLLGVTRPWSGGGEAARAADDGRLGPAATAAWLSRSERVLKADLLARLGRSPQVVFFGGSRATRFEPAWLQRRTGLTAFNLAMKGAGPEDAWVFAHFLHRLDPRARPVWVWGLQRSTLYLHGIDPGLVLDPRLSRYLPPRLVARERRRLARLAPPPPRPRDAGPRWGPDGVLLANPYDRRGQRWNLARSLDRYIRRALGRQRWATGPARPRPCRSRRMFVRTLAYLNRLGVRPILVSMPVHPRVLAALEPTGWRRKQARFLAWLDSLHGRYRFDLVDLTDLRSFGGTPDGFYDGVHITAANARRVIDELVRRFPERFRAVEGDR